MTRPHRRIITTAALALALDLLTKAWAERTLEVKLNRVEKALMNNPVRAAVERHYEAPLLERLGYRLDSMHIAVFTHEASELLVIANGLCVAWRVA